VFMCGIRVSCLKEFTVDTGQVPGLEGIASAGVLDALLCLRVYLDEIELFYVEKDCIVRGPISS
jgi:hypothetical protein